MKKIQKLYLAISIFVVVSGQILTLFYRPYIYANKINDFGFADTIGSLVSVIGFCFLIWSFKNYPDKKKNQHILIAMTIYTVFWESLGLFGIYGTFDWKDIVAGVISGGLTYILKELIEKAYKPEVLPGNLN